MSDYTENKTPNLIINTLEDPSKLSEITVGENEIVLVPDDIEEEIAGKVDKVSTVSQIYGTDENGDQTTYNKSDFQDTLTAGTNISIVNNVISATASESFFRGRFSNWTNTPTDVALYEADYHGNHTPTESDYMVLTDASDYVGINKKYEFVYTKYHNMSINGSSTIDIHSGYDYTDEGITFYIRKSSSYIYVITADSDVIQNGNIVTAGTVLGTWSEGVDTYTTICYSATAPDYDGSWRFGYHGTWSVDGKNGWKPEYQVEETLPDATDSVKGIAKLYTTTGANTDGAIDQNGTTTAINTAVSTHNTASNAHSNIRGTANGLATLDGNAKVPLAQMNDAVLGNVNYQGLWNAATNDPFLIDPSGGLPAGYNAIEYIDFNGTQYIDTGVVVDSTFDTLGYDFKFLATSTGSFVYGSSTSGYYGTATGALSLSNGYFVGNSRISSTARTANTEYTINVTIIRNNNTLAYNENGITGGGQYSGDIIQQNSIAIGGIHTNSYEWKFLGRIYYFTIKKNGVPIKQYQPAIRLSDNAYGFYEMVSGTFVTATGGVFTSGGGAIEIPKGHYYITSTAGTQFGIHFEVGDWVISTGTSWTKVDNTDAVSSVEGRTGNVTVINDNASTGATTYTWSADKLTTEFSNVPTVNNSTITITQGGVTKGSFTLNQASGDTIALDAGSGGSVPDATDQVKGIAKLYNTYGLNTDGSMTQSAITNEIINSVNTREISEGKWIDIWFSSYWSGTRVYLEDIKNQSSTTYATYLSTLSDLYTNRSATMATLKIPYNSGRTCYLYLVDNNEYYFFLPKDGKRLRVYDDNGTIKFEESMFKDFALMSDLPTVYNPTITITQGGVTKGSFTLNQASGDTIALDMGVSLDNTTITKNAYDNIQTIATINPNPASGRINPIYDWVGTLAEYTAQDIETNHPDYVCFITDDFTAPTFDAYSKVQSDARYVQKAHEVIEFQAPTAQNNYTWYRKYADGWVEQGGKLDGFVNGSASWLNKTVSLPIQMADTNYSVIASDCGIGQNTTHGTYNLPTSSTQWSYYYYNASDSRVVHWQVSGMYAQ